MRPYTVLNRERASRTSSGKGVRFSLRADGRGRIARCSMAAAGAIAVRPCSRAGALRG